eukprot:SAG31_NODE_23_length_33717_cov_17.863585_11_plen_102_part_00
MADHSALKLRRLTRTCGHLSGKASLDLSSSSESAVPAGLHGLSAVERYYFETQGFVVIPDIIPRCLLAELNAVNDRDLFAAQARLNLPQSLCYAIFRCDLW